MTATAHLEEWTGADVHVDDVERQLAALREAAASDDVPDLRTSVMTHIAWVPPEWERAATDTLAGLAERHPSRALLLVPEPRADDGMDAHVALRCFAVGGQERHVCSEVIELRLRGRRALAPASIVVPLLIPDLPVFLRWRGRPDFSSPVLEQLLRVVDRLVVDSAEWPDVPAAFGDLAQIFDTVAVSDIAWSRTLGWRRRIAELWPAVAAPTALRVEGPASEAHLLAGWLRSRLGVGVALEHVPADSLRAVAVDGADAGPPRARPPTPSELLSVELDRFSRDSVYEAAVVAA